MKIDINILPDEQKAKRDQGKKIGLILRFGFSLAFALLVLVAALSLIQFVLNLDYQDAKKVTAANAGRFSGSNDLDEAFLKDLNAKVKKITVIQSDLPRWSQVVRRIADICPEEIKITLINVEQMHVKMSGFSKTRDSFLGFQEKLKSEGLKNVNSPISNLVAPSDFKFDIEIDLDKAYLEKISGE